MEIPEKIYVTEGMLFATNPEITLPKNDKIEYICKDAYIKKACEVLNIYLVDTLLGILTLEILMK